MENSDDIKSLLKEIRNNQQMLITNQEKQIAIAEEQSERSKLKIEESLGLQREAIGKYRTVLMFAVPSILICILAIGYIFLKYLV